MIVLAIPNKRVHESEEDCNQDVLDELDDYESEEETDPRWDALKNLK